MAAPAAPMVDFSQLPKEIIHHILSYLETDEAVKTSILCKTWYNSWLTCPSFNFHEADKSTDKFFKFMKSGKTFHRYRDQKIHIEQLNLNLSIWNNLSRATRRSFLTALSDVDQFIITAVRNGIRRLELDITIDSYSYSMEDEKLEHTLPAILFEAKSLRELSISSDYYLCSYLVLKKAVDDKVMFIYLRKLKLSNVSIDDDLFQVIMVSCPLIEDLQISLCLSLKRIEVTKLYHLKKLKIHTDSQDVEIEAPNLQYLALDFNSFNLHVEVEAPNLQNLALIDGVIPSSICEFLDNLGHKFPQLEYLRLPDPPGDYKVINILSHSLKHVMLMFSSPTSKYLEVNIDAPKMALIELHGVGCLSLANAPSQLVKRNL